MVDKQNVQQTIDSTLLRTTATRQAGAFAVDYPGQPPHELNSMAVAGSIIDSILAAIAEQKQQEYLASKMRPFTIASTMFNFHKVIDSMEIKQDGRRDEAYLSHQVLLEDEAEPESMGEKEKHMPLQRVMPSRQPDINL